MSKPAKIFQLTPTTRLADSPARLADSPEGIRVRQDGEIKEFIDRILTLESEKDGLTADIAEVYEEAADAALDKKVLRAAVQRLRKGRRTEFEHYELRRYLRASGRVDEQLEFWL